MFAKKFRKIKNYSIINALVSHLKYFAIIDLLFILWTLNNMVFSRNFNLLPFRGIDDIAFTTTIFNLNAHFSFNFSELVEFTKHLNDYGYGAVFWLTYFLILFPLIRLDQVFSNEFFQTILIFASREIASVCIFVSFYLFMKKTNLFVNKKNNIAQIRLLISIIAISPIFGFSATRFHPMALNILLITISVLALISNSKLKIFKFSLPTFAIYLAAAVGVKFNSILIVPVLTMVYVYRLGIEKFSNRIKELILLLFLVFTLAILFASPTFLFELIFYRKSHYINQVMSLSKMIGISDGNENSFLETFNAAILFPSSAISIYVIVFLYLSIKNRREWFQTTFLIVSIIFYIFFLVWKVKIGYTYIANYWSAFFVLVSVFFVLIINQSMKSRGINIIIMLILVLNLVSNFHFIKSQNVYFSNISWVQQAESESTMEKLNEMKWIKQTTKNLEIKNILMEYQITSPYSNLQRNYNVDWIFDNLSSKKSELLSCKYDMLLISKKDKYNSYISTNSGKKSFTASEINEFQFEQDIINNKKHFCYTRKIESRSAIILLPEN